MDSSALPQEVLDLKFISSSYTWSHDGARQLAGFRSSHTLHEYFRAAVTLALACSQSLSPQQLRQIRHAPGTFFFVLSKNNSVYVLTEHSTTGSEIGGDRGKKNSSEEEEIQTRH